MPVYNVEFFVSLQKRPSLIDSQLNWHSRFPKQFRPEYKTLAVIKNEPTLTSFSFISVFQSNNTILQEINVKNVDPVFECTTSWLWASSLNH